MHTSLSCTSCGLSHPVDRLQNLCTACGKPLRADYDLDRLRERFAAVAAGSRTIRSMWKFWDVLPVHSPDEAISLGEGLTPLIRCRRSGPFDSLPNLFVK